MPLIPAPLIALIGVLVLAVGVAAYAILRDRERRRLMDRAGIQFADDSILLKSTEESIGGRIAKWLVFAELCRGQAAACGVRVTCRSSDFFHDTLGMRPSGTIASVSSRPEKERVDIRSRDGDLRADRVGASAGVH